MANRDQALTAKACGGTETGVHAKGHPVVSRKDAQGRRHRHDVVMDAKHAMDYRKMVPGERPPLSEITQEAGSWWLDDRAQ
jgi:hypothetical protein